MTGRLDLGGSSPDKVVGEVYRLIDSDIIIYLLPERLDWVNPGSFLYIDTGDGGIVALAGSKAIDPKYTGRFQPMLGNKAREGLDMSRLYEFLFRAHPIYEVDSSGNILRSFRLFVKPHNPVYLLSDEQVVDLLGEEPDLSFLRYLNMMDVILVRNLAVYLSRLLAGRMGVEELYKEFLRSCGGNLEAQETVTRVFMEVVRGG